jgi:hypothetical protein
MESVQMTQQRNRARLAGGPQSPFSPSFTDANRIRIEFVPAKSSRVTECDQIVDIQFVRIHANDQVLKPSDFYKPWVFRDPVATDELWWVDFLNGETTPDYQQGGAVGQVGFRKPAGDRDAWIPDAPQAAGGGTKGFKTPSNPTGWERVSFEFRTFCWCMWGPQCDVWYEGISWLYTKTYEDFAAGRPGVSSIEDNELVSFPPELDEAFRKFNSNFGFQPCK